ncbi:uncharacterized protein LOC143890812 [Tasmannia lanceolata]|uniref:uncharacterized protein LOC143890812 n=1 Tax=Tasmannia lanceolata TaxID=3420 RepID=UPI004063C106
MRVSGKNWCFCSGGGRSEKMKGAIFSGKGPAMANVGIGTGFLIHKNLLLTTHINLPSVAAAEDAEIKLQDRIAARLVPHRFFITSSVLDLTIVGFDPMDGDLTAQVPHPHYLKTSYKPSLDLGSVVYLLGHAEKKELTIGEGKVVIATDNLIKLSTDGITWSPGSAGFDVQGNLAFMVCDPMKLATSPTAKSSSTSSSSSSSWKKDLPMQFGIPIPIICDWLNQHWEGNLDELNKPKLPLIRLMSSGQKSDHSCVSFTMRRVFKSTEGEIDGESSSSQIMSRPTENVCEEETPFSNLHASTHEQGIPTPEIYESRTLTAGPIRKKENTQTTQTQLLDINFPPRIPKSIVLPLPIKQLLPHSDENVVENSKLHILSREDTFYEAGPANLNGDSDIAPSGFATGNCSEVQSSSSPLEASEFQNGDDGFHAGYSSEGETMYSAETMESRNYTSPRENKFQQVGRSHSCVSYRVWGATQRNSATSRGSLEQQRSLIQERKMYSQGAMSQRTKGHDYFSPTVSSIMKKRNNSEQLPRPRQNVVQLSPKWNF